MSALSIICVIVAVCCLLFVSWELSKEVAAIWTDKEGIGTNPASEQLKALTAARRAAKGKNNEANDGVDVSLVMAAAAESEVSSRDQEINSYRLTLRDRLQYAKWPVSALQFRMLQMFTTILFLIPAYLYTTIFIQLLTIVLVPALMSTILTIAINKRVSAFDRDYPVMLMQFVSMLKTGVNPTTGLEAVAKALDPHSLVRAEIELLINRLRLGMNEEQAFHAFGEDIAHPEIELFVQSLLLHSRIGGTLSTTLERLARQVRKRQQFRDQAIAAVGMERMSIYAIAAILTCLLIYMVIKAPELVIPGFQNPMGQQISQGGLALIVFGFYWSTIVTKIKV